MSTNTYHYPTYLPQSGVMTDSIRSRYIDKAIEQNLLPEQSHRLAPVVSLVAPDDPNKPIQFWQLYSVMGPHRVARGIDINLLASKSQLVNKALSL